MFPCHLRQACRWISFWPWDAPEIHSSRRSRGQHGALLALSHDLLMRHPHSSASQGLCIQRIPVDWTEAGSQLELRHELQPLLSSWRGGREDLANSSLLLWCSPGDSHQWRGEICASQRCEVISDTGTLTLLLALWCWRPHLRQHNTLHASDIDLQLNCFLFPDIMCCDRATE